MIAKDSFIILQSGTELTGALCRVGLKNREVSYPVSYTHLTLPTKA